MARIVSMVWEEFYSCDPKASDGDSQDCDCKKCFDPTNIEFISSKAKCRMIPEEI